MMRQSNETLSHEAKKKKLEEFEEKARYLKEQKHITQ